MVCDWSAMGASHRGEAPADVGVSSKLHHLAVACLTVNALVFGSCLAVLGYIVWWRRTEKRRHNLLALHNLRSIVLLVAVLVGIGEIGHQWLTVARLGQVLVACPTTTQPEAVHSPQSEAVPLTIDRRTPAVATEMPTVHRSAELVNGSVDGGTGVARDAVLLGLVAVWVGLVAQGALAVLVRAIERRDKCGLLCMAVVAEGAQSIVRWCKFKYITDGVTSESSATAGDATIFESPEVCLTLAGALATTALTIVDGSTWYLERNSGRRHVSSIMSNERKLGYKTPHSPFLSKITFHWIVPLLWRGYQEPLELESLGALHEKDTSRYHYDQFLFIYQSYKSTRASLWRCYVRNGWRMFLVGGLLKLAGDLCALVGPLCISNIVDYIASTTTQQHNPDGSVAVTVGLVAAVSASLILGNDTMVKGAIDKSNQSPVGMAGAGVLGQPPPQPPAVATILLTSSWSSFFANGWIVCVLVLIASLAQGTLSQASTHLMDGEGIRLKNALQGLVYRKTLLLSTSCFHAVAANATPEKQSSSEPQREPENEGSLHWNRVGGSRNRSKVVADAELAPVNATADVQQHGTVRYANIGHGEVAPPSRDPSTNVNRAHDDRTEMVGTTATRGGTGNAAPSSSSTGEQMGSITDSGTITNLMSDDAFNVMSFVKMVHYVWAIPLKIAVVMYLLYRQLGISTVIGSVVCIVTMTPLQLLIGKLMAANSKKASECTDERLRRINEVLLGIKLIKLNAWEGVFKDKISVARQQELRHLDLDSIYWTLMMLLTHVSSVLITIVTIAVFLGLENNPIELTAGRLFASLALFNQLTVPLFIFPITIPVTLSAIVSTGRLEAFLSQPEVERGSLEGIRTMARILSRSNASLDMYETGDEEEPPEDGVSHHETDPLRGQQEERVATGSQPESQSVHHGSTVNREESMKSLVNDPAGPSDNPAGEGRSSLERTKLPPSSKHSSISSSTSRSIRSGTGRNDEDEATLTASCERRTVRLPRPAKYQKTACNPRVKLKKNSQLSVSARLEKCRQKQKHLAREMRFGVPDDAAVYLQDARFRWMATTTTMVAVDAVRPPDGSLHIEQLTIPKGKLTMIVGRSGSGKSSLLAALLKEINHLSGELLWNKYSTIAYVPQKAWLQNATIRENVLFGESYRPKRYDRVLRACALRPDLDLMPAGDATEIGERGLKLSGGQRQRIAIARALYSSANVVILDDPLSALDNEVAMYVFEHGIHRMLTRQKRTAILVTQQLQLVHRADNIVALEGGTVSATGSPTEIENNYPHIHREWNAIIAKEQQRRQSSIAQASPGRTARERWKLFKNISKIGFLRNHPPEENDFMERTLYNPRASGSRSPFGCQFSAHDFPLPIEECHEPNVALRRHFSSRLRMDLSPKRSDPRRGVATFSLPATVAPHPNVYRTRSLQTTGGNAEPMSGDGRAGIETDSPVRKQAVVVRHISFPITPGCCGGPIRTPTAITRQECRLPEATVGEASVRAEMVAGARGQENSCEDLKRSAAIGFRIPDFLRRLSARGRRFSNPTELYPRRNPSSRKGSRKATSLKSVPGERRHRSLRRFLSTISRRSEDTEESSVDGGEAEVSNRLIYDDERKYGRIPTRTYWLYLQSCGLKMVATFFLSALAQQALKVYTDFWLQEWTERGSSWNDDADVMPTTTTTNNSAVEGFVPSRSAINVQHYFQIYAALSAVCIVLAAISVPAGQRAGSNARRRLHRALIASVLQNSIHFFQSVPLGRVMNRLSVDVAVVDKKIAATSQKLLQFILLCLCAVLINSVVTPYFILLTIPICGIYYVVQKFYRASSRELQRIESITYSPVLSHFAETIEGVTTIRAFGQESRFMEALFRRMEANNVAQVVLNCSNRWLGIALDYLGAVIVFVAILTALITASVRPHSTSSSLIGLAINYAMLVPIYLNWVVKLFAEMEMYGGAVERIQSFIEPTAAAATGSKEHHRAVAHCLVPSTVSRVMERPDRDECVRRTDTYKSVPISWPLRGDIVYEGVTLRYENQKENVITNLSLTIPAGQRLGICGRTGSGKSSLALALFGALEVTAGRILIDDVDIVGLHTDELRSRLSIIPQEVMLFGGSVRENLDPRGHFSDLELWNCLELAQLKSIVKLLPNGLDTNISEEKHYFSSGQRQLFCLARAILRGSVCLVLDEATSSLDTDTEQLVLRAAKKAFKGRTVITIAHRLHSLFDHDRVLVLEQGRIVEDGCPRVLASTAGSKFGAMLQMASNTPDDRAHQHSIKEADDG
ncbi:ATP-binding cassette sub-family C member Sur isoform X2 [Anopheles aquasalis]|uniref:ATP-binding cassette sub-family C member Sur isoform X2 n=1 Tax=Anopheles aquasalis TaxID=42839 RepID=UPI00215A584F|nr:ATP-binding cassette sub-family C member Sur isoform X2 [Anopheles aquasalis]